MKRLIAILVILILGSAYAFAAPVSREDALDYAKKFLGCTDTSELTLSGIGGDGSAPAFYVINRAGGGFVLVSCDDNVDTLLGYAHTGSFPTEGAPDNTAALQLLKELLDNGTITQEQYDLLAGGIQVPPVAPET